MIAYHYSISYREGSSLINDYDKKSQTVEPFLMALRNGRDWFDLLLLTEMYHARLAEREDKFHNYVKDATEAVFEYVRETEFAKNSASRINCVYYFADLSAAVKAAYADWIDCGDATKEEVKMLEVQVADGSVFEYDQVFYDRAYELMKQHDVTNALACARHYFASDKTEAPILEYLSSGTNHIIQEISY